MNSLPASDRLRVLPLFIALCFAAAFIGAAFPPDAWYRELQRPAWAPPNWLFAPVWTTLYLMIAVAGWLLWRQVGWRATATRLWALQLLLNAAWTPLFFGLHWMGVALFEMALLWLTIVFCLRAAWTISRPAALLLLPYLAWISFAWVLNAGFWWLNR